MKNKIIAATACSVIALSVCASSSAAWAQSSVAAPTDDSGDSAEIVVTAQKREERLATVPAAVTVVSAQQLVTSGAVAARDLAGRVPSLQAGGGYGSGSFVFRGLNTGIATSPVVGIQIDGAPIGATAGLGLGAVVLPQIDPSTIERIEALRGPQGTVYGGNTLGGVINYVTTEPSLTETLGSLFLEGSTTKSGAGNFTARGMISTPLVDDTLGLQLSAFGNRQDGFIDATTAGRQNYNFNHAYGGRAALLWQATPSLQVQLSHLYSNVQSYLDLVVTDPATHKPVGLGLTLAQGVLPKYDNRFHVTTLKADLEVGSSTLSYIGTLQNAESRWFTDASASTLGGLFAALPAFGGVTLAPDDFILVDAPQRVKKTTQELRFASPNSGRLRWLVGGFFSDESASVDQTIGAAKAGQLRNTDASGSLLRFTISTHLKEYAAFANLNFYVTPKLDVTGGIRISRIEQDFQQAFSGNDAAAYNTLFTVLGFDPTPALSPLAKDSRTLKNYQANVRYTFSPSAMVYLRYSTGVRVGGPNTIVAGLPASYAPDSTDNFEVGLKANLLDRRVYFELTAFDVKWRDIQVATIGQGGTSGVINGGRASSRGFEASLTAKPIDGLSLSGWLAYNDAKLDENVITAAGVIGLKGDPLPNASKWSGAVSADYKWPLSDQVEGFVAGDFRFNGRRDVALRSSTSFAPAYTMPSYGLADLRAGLRYQKYELTLFVRNIANVRAQLGGTTNGVVNIVLQRPKTIGASLAARF